MGRLDGKVVVVTGASRGLGAEIAALLAAEGGRVVCAARTLREGDHRLAGSLETTVDAIRARGGQAHAVTVNIADPEECARLLDEARKVYGPVDVLVNNAALTYFVPIKDYAVGKWLASWAVNVHAPFVLSQLALGDMIPRKAGAIINIGSGAAIGPGRGPYPDPAAGARGGTCYGAQKAALERFTQGLAAEVYPFGAHPRHRLPQARPGHGRPPRRAARAHGPRGAAAGERAARPGDRTRDLQPADPQGVRRDHRGARPGRRDGGHRVLTDLVGDERAIGCAHRPGGQGIFIASSRRSRSCPSVRSHTSARSSGVHAVVVVAVRMGAGCEYTLTSVPRTPITCPVMCAARSLARNATTGAIASGGVAVAAPRRSLGSRWVMRVSAVGEMALQRTPYLAMASAVERISPTMPSLAAE
jgi:NAD(P)-dependent dehydrogenase (short-subunit alcohol dehydrogenase family)